MREIYYVGDKFYMESGTTMSSIYEVMPDGRTFRCDWGTVQSYLRQGEEIHLRPATAAELLDAYQRLEEIRSKRNG